MAVRRHTRRHAGFVDSVRNLLRDLGFSVGKDIAFDFRYPEGKGERLTDLATELVTLKPDLIVALATPGTRAAKLATTTIPIVMVAVSDPVGEGFCCSRRPIYAGQVAAHRAAA